MLKISHMPNTTKCALTIILNCVKVKEILMTLITDIQCSVGGTHRHPHWVRIGMVLRSYVPRPRLDQHPNYAKHQVEMSCVSASRA